MKMKPILFSTPMVQALLAGRKTQTRRIVDPQPTVKEDIFPTSATRGVCLTYSRGEFNQITDYYGAINFCEKFARFKINDILYVREQHYRWGKWVTNGVSKTGKTKWRFKALNTDVLFEDNKPSTFHISRDKNHPELPALYKRNSLFMPKSAARIFLEVTKVRVEKASDISNIDAINEGVTILNSEWIFKHFPEYEKEYRLWDIKENGIIKPPLDPIPKQKFKSLWNSINGPETWNNWVFVYDFEITEKPEL